MRIGNKTGALKQAQGLHSRSKLRELTMSRKLRTKVDMAQGNYDLS